jgi:ATP-dependent DNA helicase RecG
VATSVVEVGVDVPNATVMVIEGAERFGLAQLHQFRGRIGRGNAPSICFLVAESPTGEAIDRLSAVVRSTSGLDLAEEDLRIRGPGEYYGLRQSGFPPLRVARFTDLELIQRTRGVASGILKRDPGLSREEHGGLRRAVQAFDPGAGEAN